MHLKEEQVEVDDYISQQRELSQDMTKLLSNELFQKLIIENFIKEGILSNALNQNLDNDRTLDELKARRILHEYIFNAIIVNE
jgi:hypothetical protein